MKTDNEKNEQIIVWEAEPIQFDNLGTSETFTEIGQHVTSILTTLQAQTASESNDDSKSDQTVEIKHENLYIICDLCPFMCLSEGKINEHISLVHKTKKASEVYEMACPACPNIFLHKLSLQAHLEYDHCVTDEADVARIVQIALHTKKATLYENKQVSGTTTSFISVAEDAIDEEKFSDAILIENVHLDNVKTAEDCEDVDDKKPLAKFLDATKKFFKCTMMNCKVRMQQMEKLNYHTLCHSETIFKCLECDEAFAVWKSLAGHLWRSHKIDMELFCCDQCNYRTHSLSKLNNTHKLIHTDVRNFACDICEKMFKNLKQLRNHKDTHKKAKTLSFLCKECNKSFSSKHQLKVHKDGIHKKLKPFLCNICGYKGATRSGFMMHLRQHTGEKPFKCGLCPYSTADHNSLRRHKLRHSGEKPYKCTECDYQCIQSSTYKIHIKTKHPGLDKELLFSCPHCQFRSISKHLYNSHIKTQHPEIKI